MTHRLKRNTRTTTTLLTLTGTAAIACGVLAGLSSPAHADPLCDQMRAQYGAGWPCISVPTYTPPPAQNTPPPTTGGNNPGSTSGPGITGNPGPGPGQGNGTPIVEVPGQQPPLQVPQSPTADRTTQAPSPEQGAPTGQPVPSTGAPATGSNPTGSGANTATNNPPRAGTVAGLDIATGLDTPLDSDASIPLPIWILAGAAALAVSHPRTRSLLSRGGSTRATVGPSRLVLIHDDTSPNTYRFAMDVPPGGHTEVNPDGSATVYDRDGNPVQQVARPWAFDATGQPQKTWYTVDDNGDLIQHVEPTENAVYPILADPTDTSLLKPQPGDPGFVGPVTPEQQQQARTEQAKQTPPANDGLSDLLTAGITDQPPATEPDTSPTQGTEPAPGQQLGYDDWVANNYLGQDAPQQHPQDDNSGLSDLLTAGITDQPPATEPDTSPTQGTEPAPGQQLGYDDWVANNYLGQDVGVVNTRTGADGQPEYYRTTPDGTEVTAITAHTATNGGVIYGFEDGTVVATDIGDGVSAEIRPDESGGFQLINPSTGQPLDPSGPGVTAALAAAGRRGDDIADAFRQTGQHSTDRPPRHSGGRAGLSSDELSRLSKVGKGLSRGANVAGIAVTFADELIKAGRGEQDYGDAAVVAGGAIAGGAVAGAAAGMVVGSFAGPIGTAVGAGIGAAIGSQAGGDAARAIKGLFD